MKHRNFFRKLPGFQGNGDWFFGHTLKIRKNGHIQLLKEFPSFYKFSNGLWSNHISCHDPGLIRHVIENSDKSIDQLPINILIWRGESLGTRLIGPRLKRLRTIFHKCYGLESKQYWIKTCRNVCDLAIDKLGILENEYKILEIRSLLSGLDPKLSCETWFGKGYAKIEKMLKKRPRNGEITTKNGFAYCWNLIHKAVHSANRRQECVFLHRDILTKRRTKYLNSKINSDGQSILDRLIRLENKGEITLSDEQFTSLFISHLTLSQAIQQTFVWLIKTLAENRFWQDKIFDEIMEMKRNGSHSDNLPFEKSVALNMFVCETLRLYPSDMITREITRSFEFDGHVFPVGTLVDIDLQSLHRNPLFWEFPEKFMPERFSTGNQRNGYTYLPFSAGPRMCPGKHFILVMMKTFLITFIERLDFDTVITTDDSQKIQPLKVTGRVVEPGHAFLESFTVNPL